MPLLLRKGAGVAPAGQLAIALCMTFSVIMASLIFGFRHNLGRIFVDDPDVVAMVKQVAWLAAVYQLPDCFFGVISGILRCVGSVFHQTACISQLRKQVQLWPRFVFVWR